MSLLTPKRIESDELLDEAGAPFEEMARSLRDLQRINRYAGGQRVYERLLARVAPKTEESLSVLDLGTGTSDLLLNAAGRRPLKAFGLDFRIEHLLYGRRDGKVRLPLVTGDAMKLPFRTSSVDVLTSSHFFHHFSEEENVALLHESVRVARRAVIVTDTRRHRAPLLFVQLISTLRLVGRITRFDAPASVRQGYTLDEVERIARQVKCLRSEVIRLLPFRFGLILWK
ncbi:MAG TPA: methyltransferase domain-containing protein [Thermoanaerobaculia bacterium]|nr:methyltransferase domain-containing protein [Thermoanaerobaculia bacterium]